MKTYVAIWALAVMAAAPLALAETEYEAKANEQIMIGCTCVLATSGLCDRAVWDDLAGSQRHSWNQPASVLAGKHYNLDELCYRKRDMDMHGGGLCCETVGDEAGTIKRLFRGSVN